MEEILASIRRIISEDQDEDGDSADAAADSEDETAFDDLEDDDIDMAAALADEAGAAPTPANEDDDDAFEAALAAELEAEGAVEPESEPESELDELLGLGEEDLAGGDDAAAAVPAEDDAGQSLDLGGLEDEPDDFDESVLELTEVVDDDEDIGGELDADLDSGPDVPTPQAPAPVPPAPVAAAAEPAAAAPVAPGGVDLATAVPAVAPEIATAASPLANHDLGSLVSQETAAQATTSFVGFAEQFQQTRGVALGSGARTLEELVKDLLRPMLKGWLDENLPPLVQRLVEREIAKLAGRADEK